MPMTGPNKDHADKVGDEATECVLALLKEKYHADRPTSLIPFMREKLNGQWDEQVKKLREVMREMIWIEYCDSF